jgi:hypothetical protein
LANFHRFGGVAYSAAAAWHTLPKWTDAGDTAMNVTATICLPHFRRVLVVGRAPMDKSGRARYLIPQRGYYPSVFSLSIAWQRNMASKHLQLGSEIADFVQSDPVLYSNYLFYMLQTDDFAKLQRDTMDPYCFFLLWFFMIGRSSFAHPLAIPASLREAVASPDTEGRHILKEYVLSKAACKFADRDQALARYYFHEVPKFRLGPFLNRTEIASIERIASFAKLAHLAKTVKSEDGAPTPRTNTLLDQLQRLARAGQTSSLPSVSIVGFHRSVSGIGEDARSLFECLLGVGITPELIDVTPKRADGSPVLESLDDEGTYSAFETSHPNGSVVIFCLPVFEMMRLIYTRGIARAGRGQYWIGYWPWETTELQSGWLRAIEYVDEVWASSRFLFDVYTSQIKKPISLIPLNVHVPRPVEPAERHEIGTLFGSAFTFLCIFDFNSQIERKNPMGAISAFRSAFPRGVENVQLVLKAIHGDRQPQDFNSIMDAIDKDARIVLIEGPLNREEVCWLIHKSQAFVSLHRSEGFGRPIAEAMLLGTPVIATGWSGNTDFLDDKTGFPIRYRLRAVAPGEYPFAAGEWAEPDLEHAADVMRSLYRRGSADPRITVKAKQIVSDLFSRQKVGAKAVERLMAIENIEKIGRQAESQ